MENILAIVTLPLPITLLNGTIADAGQVMTDLNAIASNVNSNAAKNGVNNDITSLTALISINSGLTITGATIFGSTFTSGNIISSTIDALTTGVTQPVGTNNTTLATTAFVINTAFSTALPGISPAVANFFVTNNGTVASWSNLLRTGTIRFADSADTTKRLAFDISQIPTNTTVTITIPAGFPAITIAPIPDFLLFAQGII